MKENIMEQISIVDILSQKIDNENNVEIKKLIKGLINKLNSCSTTPLNKKHAMRMLLFAENSVVYDMVLDIIKNYKIWEFYSYIGDPKGLCMYDIKAYWYMILCFAH